MSAGRESMRNEFLSLVREAVATDCKGTARKHTWHWTECARVMIVGLGSYFLTSTLSLRP